MAGVCSLPGEILLEIMSRLPKKSQRRLEMVSKEWANLIKEAASRPAKPTDFGLIVSIQRDPNSEFKDEAIFYRLQDDDDDDKESLAVEDSISFLSQSWFLAIGSCNGFVFYCRENQIDNRRIISYHLYYPFTKRHTNLPRLITPLFRRFINDPVPGALGVAPKLETNHFKFIVAFCCSQIVIFDSETREWNTKPAKFAEESYNEFALGDFTFGASHLCFEQTLFWVRPPHHNHLILFCLKTETFRLLDLPDQRYLINPRGPLWESEGRLRYSQILPTGGLRIWVLCGVVAESTRPGTNWQMIFHISLSTLNSLLAETHIKSCPLRERPSEIIRVSAFDEHLQMFHLLTADGLIVCYDIPKKRMTLLVAPSSKFDGAILLLPFSDCKYD